MAGATVTMDSEAFAAELEPDPNAFAELIVPGIMGIPQRLVELEYIPEYNKGVWVTTVIRVDDYGQPREAFLSVFREPQNHKFRARKLFKEAPESANIRLADLNYHAFNFPPSSNCSNWLSSTDLNMTVMRTNNFAKDGEYDHDEWEGINIGDASFRLVITPQDDVNKVAVSIVAIPRKLTEISSLPGNPTGLCPGYPVIEVFRVVGMMTGIQEPLRRDGFPFIPALLHTGETDVVPNIGAIKTALYSFWNSCREPNMGDLEMWLSDTAGPAAPSADQLECVYRWPEPATPARQDDEVVSSSCDDELDGSYCNAPKHVPGKSKYRGFRGRCRGLYTQSSFRNLHTLNPRLVEVLVKSANNGISENSWQQYSGVRKHLQRCQQFTGKRFSFPMDQDQANILFIK